MDVPCDASRLMVMMRIFNLDEFYDDLIAASPTTPFKLEVGYEHKKKKTIEYYWDKQCLLNSRARAGGQYLSNDDGTIEFSFKSQLAAESFFQCLFGCHMDREDVSLYKPVLDNIMNKLAKEQIRNHSSGWFHKKKWVGCPSNICEVKFVAGQRNNDPGRFKPEGWAQAKCVKLKNGSQGKTDESDETPDGEAEEEIGDADYPDDTKDYLGDVHTLGKAGDVSTAV